jgi:hypothetical protein
MTDAGCYDPGAISSQAAAASAFLEGASIIDRMQRLDHATTCRIYDAWRGDSSS